MLRLAFMSGETFGSHVGPIVARFERDFRFNRFDGPSRGPETRGPKAPGAIRILVQGDSITWGQGIRYEDALFTTRTLNKLRLEFPQVEMAVLAQPGREIDEHVDELGKWGSQIDPDVIVYQWFENDVELDHSLRPVGSWMRWRNDLFFQPWLVSHSYLWFLLDFALDKSFPSRPSYPEFMYIHYGAGTEGWTDSFGSLKNGLQLREGSTLPIAIVPYPIILKDGKRPFSIIDQQFMQLCEHEGVKVVDLTESLKDLPRVSGELYASRYDLHPGLTAHERISDALSRELGLILTAGRGT